MNIFVDKTFKIEIQKGDKIIQTFGRIGWGGGPTPEIRSLVFNFWKFEDS